MKNFTRFHEHLSYRCLVSKKQLLFLMALLITIVGYSQSFFVQDTNGNMLRYSVTSSNTVSLITGSAISNTSVSIHASVTNGGTTYSVTSIDNNALGSSVVTNVDIPNTVTSIGQGAFNLANLTSVVLPSNLQTIGNFAFGGNQLTVLTIPSNVTSIGSGAFRDNNGLTSVTVLANVPPTITTASDFNDTFYDTVTQDRSDIDLIIPAGTTGAYVTDPGALWTGFNSVTENLNVGDTFVVDFITYRITSLSPYTVEVLDYNTAGGTIVNIPSVVSNGVLTYVVNEIHDNAFNTKGLTSVTISDTVINIGIQAFIDNTLTSVTIGNSVETIGGLAFDSNNLTSIDIPNSVQTIGARAFDDNQITDVIIGNGVTNIEFAAFRGNPLSTVISLAVIPPTIITDPAFPAVVDSFSNDRSNINLVITNTTTDEYVTDPGALWTGFKMVFEATSPTTAEVSHYDPANGTNVTIPASVTAGSIAFDIVKIDDSAFENIGLTSVTIPNSVTEIGISAFNTNNLTSVTIPDSVTLISTTAFATNSITNLSLGANVTDIAIGAFVDNNLSSVTIPSNVTFIGLLAFGNNPLTDVYTESFVPPTITTGTNDTFAFNRSNIHLHIPPGTMGAYVTDPGALWTGFNPVTEDALSIDEFELANTVKVITSTDALEIIIDNSLQLQDYTMYSISGMEIVRGKESNIPTSTFARGIYILKLNFDKGVVTKKVIIN